nr:unnamed protein product [Callosobruchus analis]
MWPSFLVVLCFAAAFCDRLLSESNVSNVSDRSIYNISFSTAEGIKRSEAGFLRQKGNRSFLVVKGIYSWLSGDGRIWQVTYEADENGFRSMTSYLPIITIKTKILSSAIASLSGGGLG